MARKRAQSATLEMVRGGLSTSEASRTPPFGVRIPQQKATVHANPWSSGECRPITLPPPTPAAIYPADSLGVVSAAALSDPAPCFIGQQDRLHHALEQSERRRLERWGGRPLGPAPWQFRPAARS